jgi:hypothetical protein
MAAETLTVASFHSVVSVREALTSAVMMVLPLFSCWLLMTAPR